MNADDYNKREIEAGRITAEHITTLTRAYQRAAKLEPDGKLGPMTRRALEAVPDVADDATTAVRPLPLRGAAAAVQWARDARAMWATATPAVRKAMRLTFFADSPEYENWCAAFAATCLEAGGIAVPRKGPERRGARALAVWVAQYGEWAIAPGTSTFIVVTDSEMARWAQAMASRLQPGDLLCWRRPGTGWEAHDALLLGVNTDASIEIAEGNATDPRTGKAGQLVVRTLKASEWPTRLQGLYGVARPNYGGGR